jgi:hypothetical protein
MRALTVAGEAMVAVAERTPIKMESFMVSWYFSVLCLKVEFEDSGEA